MTWKSGKGITVLLLAAAVLLAGCGAPMDGAGFAQKTDVNTTAGTYSMGGSAYEEETGLESSYDSADYGNDAGNTALLEGRKLIKTVELEMETREFGETMSALETQIQEIGRAHV